VSCVERVPYGDHSDGGRPQADFTFRHWRAKAAAKKAAQQAAIAKKQASLRGAQQKKAADKIKTKLSKKKSGGGLGNLFSGIYGSVDLYD